MGIGNLNTLCKVLPPSNRVEAMPPVSYTHLDVYKRQSENRSYGWVVKYTRFNPYITVLFNAQSSRDERNKT